MEKKIQISEIFNWMDTGKVFVQCKADNEKILLPNIKDKGTMVFKRDKDEYILQKGYGTLLELIKLSNTKSKDIIEIEII